MTSRELTSGFDYWSRGHLRMAVVHLPIKFGALVFSGYKDLIFLSFRLESPTHAPKISVVWAFTSKIKGHFV